MSPALTVQPWFCVRVVAPATQLRLLWMKLLFVLATLNDSGDLVVVAATGAPGLLLCHMTAVVAHRGDDVGGAAAFADAATTAGVAYGNETGDGDGDTRCC